MLTPPAEADLFISYQIFFHSQTMHYFYLLFFYPQNWFAVFEQSNEIISIVSTVQL